MRKILIGITLALCCAVASGQQAPAKPPAPAGKAEKPAKPSLWSQLPQETLKFSKPIPLPTAPQSPAMIGRIKCSPKGRAFLEIPMPPTHMIEPSRMLESSRFVAIDKDGKVTVFPKIGHPLGFKDVTPLYYFATDNAVYVLVGGTKIMPSAGLGEAPAKGKYKYLILRYSQDDTLEATETLATLQGSFAPEKFAPLASGGFIVIGVDPVNNVPEMFLLDSDGRHPQPVDLAGSGLYSTAKLSKFYHPRRLKGVPPGAPSMVPSYALGAMQLVPYGHHVLLVQTGTNYPVSVLGNGGIERTVSLKLPPGATIRYFIPSSEKTWYAKLTDPSKPQWNHTILAFDPISGEPLRRILFTGSRPGYPVGCISHGTWMAFTRVPRKGSKFGTLALLTASQ